MIPFAVIPEHKPVIGLPGLASIRSEEVISQIRFRPDSEVRAFRVKFDPAAIQNQLVQNGSSYFFLDLASGLRYVFNGASNFRLEQILDRSGNALTIAYQGALISRVSDQLGRTLDFTYTSGRLVSVQDQSGRKP